MFNCCFMKWNFVWPTIIENRVKRSQTDHFKINLYWWVFSANKCMLVICTWIGFQKKIIPVLENSYIKWSFWTFISFFHPIIIGKSVWANRSCTTFWMQKKISEKNQVAISSYTFLSWFSSFLLVIFFREKKNVSCYQNN